MYASIQRWGNSSAVRIPKAILETAKLTENERVEMIVRDGAIMILPAKRKHKSLEELFEGYDGVYDFEEVDFGRAGREIL